MKSLRNILSSSYGGERDKCASNQIVQHTCQVPRPPRSRESNDPFEHGGLLSLNAWKLGPTPQNIEVVASPHSNEPSNRCPLEPAVHEVHET